MKIRIRHCKENEKANVTLVFENRWLYSTSFKNRRVSIIWLGCEIYGRDDCGHKGLVGFNIVICNFKFEINVITPKGNV